MKLLFRLLVCNTNFSEISPGVMSPMCIVILNHIFLDVFGKIWANDLFPGLLEPTPYAQCICSNIGKRNFINFSHVSYFEGGILVKLLDVILRLF